MSFRFLKSVFFKLPRFKKTPKKSHPNLVLECSLPISSQHLRQPPDRIPRRLAIQMPRHAQQAKTRPLPLRIVHHCIEITVTRVPTAMVILCHSLRIDPRPRDQIGEGTFLVCRYDTRASGTRDLPSTRLPPLTRCNEVKNPPTSANTSRRIPMFAVNNPSGVCPAISRGSGP